MPVSKIAAESTSSSTPHTGTPNTAPEIFRLSPIVRVTLLSLYVALTAPLPILARVTHAPVPPTLLALGLVLGAIALFAALSERVIVDDVSIRVAYPAWVPSFFRKGWQLHWSEIQALKPRSTGQGGIVYYFVSQEQKAYLLPMRVAGFARLVRRVEQATRIDTTDVRPLAQPWMYLILFGLTCLLLLVDAWVFWTASTGAIATVGAF